MTATLDSPASAAACATADPQLDTARSARSCSARPVSVGTVGVGEQLLFSCGCAGLASGGLLLRVVDAGNSITVDKPPQASG